MDDIGGIPMTHELHEAISSLLRRFRALKTELDSVHQAWQTAVREQDFDRQLSLMGREHGLIRDVSAVMSAFQQLMPQKPMETKKSRRLESSSA